MNKFAYPTTKELLDSLKGYITTNLKTNQKLVSTVKAGLIDIRDELPFVMVIPQLELIHSQYNDNLFDIERTFKIDIVNNAMHIEDVRESLKIRLKALKALFSIEDLGWQLRDINGDIQAAEYLTSTEIYSEPTNFENRYTQYCEILVKLRSYFQGINPIIPTEMKEISPVQLLDYLLAQIKIGVPVFEEYWRDVTKPISLNNFPAMGVFFGEADADKNSQTNTDFNHIPVIIRVYSSLATREIAFENHLKNVESIKKWILQRPSLDGSVSNFSLTSVDYGIDSFARPFQGKTEDVPVFRSDITIDSSLIQFN